MVFECQLAHRTLYDPNLPLLQMSCSRSQGRAWLSTASRPKEGVG